MFGKEKKEKSFFIKEEQNLAFNTIYIVVDTYTGVNYLMTVGGTGSSGMTPLLYSNGDVVIDR
ncbi:MAG: DUF6440 family protein [Peptostreptococcaceae bacterium]